MSEPLPLFTDADLIHSYSRAQAIADGVLIDISELAAQSGFRFPVAITAAAYAECISLTPSAEDMGCDVVGRTCDVLTCLRLAIKLTPGHTDRVEFEVWCVRNRHQPESVKLYSVCGPGDTLDPVITIMLPGED
ncbi:MAG: DUF6573 family protein [Planctomycetota bacterium]